MSGIMKYIVIEDKHAVVFPSQILHRDAYTLFDGGGTYFGNRPQVTGAGYIGADENGKLYVYGRSEGFNIDAKPEDLRVVMGALHRPCKPM